MLYLFGWHLFSWKHLFVLIPYNIRFPIFLAQNYRWPCIWVIWAGGGVGLYVVRGLVGGSGPVWPALLFECTTFTTPSHPPTSPYLTSFKVPALLVQCPKPHITANWESNQSANLTKVLKSDLLLNQHFLSNHLGKNFWLPFFLVFWITPAPAPFPETHIYLHFSMMLIVIHAMCFIVSEFYSVTEVNNVNDSWFVFIQVNLSGRALTKWGFYDSGAFIW